MSASNGASTPPPTRISDDPRAGLEVQDLVASIPPTPAMPPATKVAVGAKLASSLAGGAGAAGASVIGSLPSAFSAGSWPFLGLGLVGLAVGGVLLVFRAEPADPPGGRAPPSAVEGPGTSDAPAPDGQKPRPDDGRDATDPRTARPAGPSLRAKESRTSSHPPRPSMDGEGLATKDPQAGVEHAHDPRIPNDLGARGRTGGAAPRLGEARTDEAPSDEEPPGAESVNPGGPTPLPSSPSSPGAVDPLAEERAILEAARASIREGALDDALARTDEHARRFPAGQLGSERDLLAIQILGLLGRRDVQRARAETFLRRYPSSPHTSYVRRVLADRAEEGTTGAPTTGPTD